MDPWSRHVLCNPTKERDDESFRGNYNQLIGIKTNQGLSVLDRRKMNETRKIGVD